MSTNLIIVIFYYQIRSYQIFIIRDIYQKHINLKIHDTWLNLHRTFQLVLSNLYRSVNIMKN